MERYTLAAKNLGAVIRCGGWLAHDVFLTKNTKLGRHVITYSHSVPRDQAVLGVGLMLGALHFAWPGLRFGLRFSPPDHPEAVNERALRRSYRAIRPWLSDLLVTEPIKAHMALEQLTVSDVCRMYDLTPDIVAIAFGLPPCEVACALHERNVWAERARGW